MSTKVDQGRDFSPLLERLRLFIAKRAISALIHARMQEAQIAQRNLKS